MNDPTEFLTGLGCDDFCLIHGYEHMKSKMGDPIPYCEACELERGENSTPSAHTERKRNVIK